MWQEYISVASLEETLEHLETGNGSARIVAGATDLLIELDRGIRKGITKLIDISRVASARQITMDEDRNIHLGPLVTHNDCISSQLIIQHAFPLAQAAWQVGSPQIRNRGTIAGNLITASPANDTITPLMGLDASVMLLSKRGLRKVALRDFYTGVRRTVMAPDEVMTDIIFPALNRHQRGIYLKFALRKAQAISVVNLSIIIDQEDRGKLSSASIAMGAVAPTIIRAMDAENYLVGKELNDDVIEYAANLTATGSRPISDIRGSAEFRRKIVYVLAKRALIALRDGKERGDFPANPVLLARPNNSGDRANTSYSITKRDPIITRVNGHEYSVETGQNKNLLRFIREDLLMIGTKEGCAEGECGACTVILDGELVMSCLVPAGRAHHAEITTIEGLANNEELHPVQQAFIDHGAVQCGYCTPGFIMSGAMLLDEKDKPSRDMIKQALTGNLCRCTGYYKIIDAIEDAAMRGGHGTL